MTQAKQGDMVKVHYTGKLDDGTVFDSSVDRDPLEFVLGEGQLIAGFEQAVLGMAPGESKTEKIPADEAYGPHREEMVVEVERQQLPDNIPLDVGRQLQIQQAPNQIIPVVITAISESKVTLDANPPLAGKDLIFEIELVGIA